jgi:hypothetical protein
MAGRHTPLAMRTVRGYYPLNNGHPTGQREPSSAGAQAEG